MARSTIAVVDVDDTVLVSPRISYFFWRLSLMFQRIGRRLQKSNSSLIAQLSNYNEVVVLTGRDAKDSHFTADQLKRAGVDFTRLVCCPRKVLIDEWKVSVVKKYGENGPVVWIDDMFSEGVPETLRSGRIPGVFAREPRSIARGARLDDRHRLGSELEWL